jgi:peptidoglycan L-alanyl-D-glutamate endopeptidase CwlK
MTFVLGQKSLERLNGVHPDLVKVVKLAITRTPVDFVVLEGLRTKERQAVLFKQGATKTMNSRHLTGHAVDLAPAIGGVVSWDWPLYHKLAPVMKAAAKELGVAITWGGDWTTFKDGPHWELRRDAYP